MFTTNSPIGFNDQAYSDASMDQSTNSSSVSPVHSGLDGFAASIMAPELGLSEIANKISPALDYGLSQTLPLLPPSEIPAGQALSDHLNNVANQNSISGDIGSIAGFVLNPINHALGAAGAGLADAFGAVGSKVVPALASKVPGIVSGGLKGATAAAASFLPSTVPGNYNPNNNSIDWGGVAKTTGLGIGMGMAIGASFAGLGIAGSKVLSSMRSKLASSGKIEDTPTNSLQVSQTDIDSALNEKVITPDEHAALTSYINKDDDNTVQDLAQKVATKNGVHGDVNITFLKPSDLQNLSVIAGDGLSSDVEQPLKSALSDYLLNTNIDEIRQDPVKMTALQAFSDHMQGRLVNKPEELSQLDNEADTARNQNITENPAIANIQSQIKNLSDKLNTLPEGSNFESNNISNKIDVLGKQLVKAKTPISLEDLDAIRSKLTKDDISPGDLNNSDYYKLNRAAIADHPYAKAILNRVNQGAKYNQQAAFKTIADNLLEMNKQGIESQASLSKVQDMLKERNSSKVKLSKDEPQVSNNQSKVSKPEEIKAQIDALDQSGNESDDLKEAKKQYNMADKFKASVGHLAELVHCLVGSIL